MINHFINKKLFTLVFFFFKISPTATSTLKPTLENAVFKIQQLTTSVNYGFNDMCSNFEAMLEETKNLKEAVILLKQQATVLTEEVDSIEVAATTELFAAHLFPGRNIPEPRARDACSGRKDHPTSFSWKHFR
ncbi:hypothetical protein BCV72DRAFT_307082 [Rhizopus microsporus var. microsporus]|uniref:Uncharacterized protein n=1 Tax=Rhizopus microsporus var. microsporus TaxID=86635 RepID=A0A1X0QYA7_RHIZD|nr:hypothetical protein BCV72DRAFT_307082 [Rhizopus microsporus var. microsporus]